MNAQLHLQRLLKVHFLELKAKNSAYSLRAFSRKLGVSAGTLSLIMLGKRKSSLKLARKIADAMMLDPQERSEVLGTFIKEQIPSSNLGNEEHYLQLSSDQFRVISEWYYFAILNLVKTHDFQPNATWIAHRLGLSESNIQQALEKLKKLGFLIEKNGKLLRAKPKYRTTDDINNLALKKSHFETLDLAKDALLEYDVNQRDYTWLTFAFDTRKMQEAKILIRKFQDEFLDLIEKENENDQVYRMAIQLFPLTKA